VFTFGLATEKTMSIKISEKGSRVRRSTFQQDRSITNYKSLTPPFIGLGVLLLLLMTGIEC
jgi:hypothetical protein